MKAEIACEGALSDVLVYQFNRCKTVITTDWTKPTAPTHLLEKQFLRLSKNAYEDGVWINEYVSVRNGAPLLTNNLTMPPKTKMEAMTVMQIMRSRIIQCK